MSSHSPGATVCRDTLSAVGSLSNSPSISRPPPEGLPSPRSFPLMCCIAKSEETSQTILPIDIATLLYKVRRDKRLVFWLHKVSRLYWLLVPYSRSRVQHARLRLSGPGYVFFGPHARSFSHNCSWNEFAHCHRTSKPEGPWTAPWIFRALQ